VSSFSDDGYPSSDKILSAKESEISKDI